MPESEVDESFGRITCCGSGDEDAYFVTPFTIDLDISDLVFTFEKDLLLFMTGANVTYNINLTNFKTK